MPVYIVQAGPTLTVVKIGWGDDAEDRVRGLQIGHHERLTIIRLIEGPRSTESWMHRRFKAQRIRGEWFRFHPDMLIVSPSYSQPSLRLPIAASRRKKPTLRVQRDLAVFLETGDALHGKRLVEWVLDLDHGQLSPKRYAAAEARYNAALAAKAA